MISFDFVAVEGLGLSGSSLMHLSLWGQGFQVAGLHGLNKPQVPKPQPRLDQSGLYQGVGSEELVFGSSCNPSSPTYELARSAKEESDRAP